MKLIRLLTLILLTSSTFAQDYKFGKVSKEELQEKFYPLDSTANAAYLYKGKKSYYILNSDQDGFDVITEVNFRIKIYNKEGFRKATQTIPFYNSGAKSNEKITTLKAYTFNLENGKIKKEKLNKKEVFETQINKYWSQKKLTMPNIKVGSVIDVKYKIMSPYFYKIDDIDFQFDIPVKQFYNYLVVPEFYKFKLFNKGFYTVSPQIRKKNTSITLTSRARSGKYVVKSTLNSNKMDFSSTEYKFLASNIPALKDDEPFVGNISNYRGGIKFELTSIDFLSIGGNIKYYSNNWENVAKQIYRTSGFGNQLDKTNYFKDDLKIILSETDNDFQKVGAIFQFVKSKIKWNNYYGKTTNKGVRNAYKESTGNVAEINLVLTSMLREAGLEANPVLISTKNNGIPLFPTLDGFNYVISMVEFTDGNYVLLDATEPYSLPNMLPIRDLNFNGRKVTKDGNSSWVNLKSNKPRTEQNYISVKITDDFIMEGFIRTKFQNFGAIKYRVDNNHIKKESLITNLEDSYKIEIEEFKVLNGDKLNEPIIRNINFSSEDLIETIANKIYINPMLFLINSENPFKQKERKFPIDFGTSWEELNTISIDIPNGYKIVSIPKPMAVKMPNDFGVFKYQVSKIGNKVVTRSILEFKKAIIGFEYYPILKEFYGDMVAKQSEKIVLEKI